MPFADLGRVTLRYELLGGAELPVLAFSNSLGADLSMWEPQLAALSPRFRILRWDARGHGQSTAPPGPYTIADLGRDAVGLLDALEIERASFCGLSMGGMIGQWLGMHAPDRLAKLALANTAAKIGSADGWNERIETVLRDGLAPIVPGTLERWFTPAFHAAHPETIAATAAMLRATNAASYAACCGAIRDADFRASIGAIEAPALVISGTCDPVTSTEDGRFLADNIPRASYAELPAAHLSNAEAAAEFNAALLDFLAE